MRTRSTSSAFALVLTTLALLIGGAELRAAEAGAPDLQKQIEQLQDKDPIVRLLAARKLGAQGPAAAAALPALQKLLDDPDADVRSVAGAAIKKIRVGAGAGDLQKLIAQLADPDAIVRLRAAKQLGEQGAAARDAAPALKKLLQDPDEDVRLVARSALKSIGVDDVAESGAKATEAGVDAQAPETVKASDVEVARVVSLFSKAEKGAGGLGRVPSRRFFLAILKNHAKVPVRIGGLRLSWLDSLGRNEIDATEVDGSDDVLPPGGQGSIWFRVECEDAARKWKIAVAQLTPMPLPPEELQALMQNEELRQKMKVVGAKPVRNQMFGLYMGESFTISNPLPRMARGVRIALYGFDQDGLLVYVVVLHAARLPDQMTRIELDPSSVEKYQRSMALVSTEAIAGFDPRMNVTTLKGEIVSVGSAKK